jgi:metal-responsive CopG/Arc/MetJ family transcriptional regulator
MSTIKTAISIEKELFNKVNKAAKQYKVSRSQFFSQAVEYLIAKSEDIELIQRINKAWDKAALSEADTFTSKGKNAYKKVLPDKW